MKIFSLLSLNDLIAKARINFLLVYMFVSACNNSTSPKAIIDEHVYLSKGDSIATAAQQTLLSNVTQAIKTDGIASAVDYCNIKAMPLTDSLSQNTNSIIQRLSNKNRNPANAICTVEDSIAWSRLKEIVSDSIHTTKHFVSQYNNNIYYYKAITIVMPACLNCHGATQENISNEALKAINAKYPNDKATGYSIGELRGMWKIKLNKL